MIIEKISTLYKVEAEKVIQIYHKYRKLGKLAVHTYFNRT